MRPLAALAAFAVFLAAAPQARAQDPAPDSPFEDVSPEIQSRSDDLDVPFVASTNAVLDAMFEFAKPTAADYVLDLGSGDGRIVIAAAARFGARGHGVDLNPGLVALANARAARAGVAGRARFYVRDLFKEDLSQATIITMYLLPEIVLKLRERLFDLAPGTRIVSHDYHLGDWRFDAARVAGSVTGGEEDIVYYWMVPAKVAGYWRWSLDHPGYFHDPVEYKARIVQHYQDMEGRVEVGIQPMRIHDARIEGAKVFFSATGEIAGRIVRHDYEGIVRGGRITGTARLSGGVTAATVPWTADRLGFD